MRSLGALNESPVVTVLVPCSNDVPQRFEEAIFGRDQRIVESQRPEQVPFDLTEELHLRFDAIAVVDRPAMKGLDKGLVDACQVRSRRPTLLIGDDVRISVLFEAGVI